MLKTEKIIKSLFGVVGITLTLLLCTLSIMTVFNQQVLDLYYAGISPVLIFSLCIAELLPIVWLIGNVVWVPLFFFVELIKS